MRRAGSGNHVITVTCVYPNMLKIPTTSLSCLPLVSQISLRATPRHYHHWSRRKWSSARPRALIVFTGPTEPLWGLSSHETTHNKTEGQAGYKITWSLDLILIYFFDFLVYFVSSGAEAQSRDHICSLNPIQCVCIAPQAAKDPWNTQKKGSGVETSQLLVLSSRKADKRGSSTTKQMLAERAEQLGGEQESFQANSGKSAAESSVQTPRKQQPVCRLVVKQS